jgi:hypothetical protein
MKRKPVTKTFVRKECHLAMKRLRRKLRGEIENLAMITERSIGLHEDRMKKIESRLSRLESAKNGH